MHARARARLRKRVIRFYSYNDGYSNSVRRRSSGNGGILRTIHLSGTWRLRERGKKGFAIRKVVQKEEAECMRRIRKRLAFREINTKHTSVVPAFSALFHSGAGNAFFPLPFPRNSRRNAPADRALAPFREGCTSYRTETSGAAVKSVHSRHGEVIKFPDTSRGNYVPRARYNCEKCVTDRRSLYP